MAVYYKPQSPIQSGEDFIYPITTADQIMKSDKTRRLEQAGLIVADNSTSLGGVAAKDYALKTDTAPDSAKLGGRAPEYYTNPRNLLDNSDFRNPVNQRGQTSYIGSDQGQYTIDRWKIWNKETLNVNDGYIEIIGRAYQYYPLNTFKNTVHTFAAKKFDGTIITTTFNPNQESIQDIYGNLLGSDGWSTIIGLTNGQYVWAALYEGSYTADTLPPYVPKGYAAELAACNAAPVDLGGGYGGGSLQAYPIGSIYISVNSTSPASLFGGTWEQIKGRFLIGTEKPENNDDGKSPGNYNYAAGSKGGEATHKLSINEIPSHAGHLYGNAGGLNGKGDAKGKWLAEIKSNGSNTSYGWNYKNNEYYPANRSLGGNAAHNNMPPYLAVYMWKRVS